MYLLAFFYLSQALATSEVGVGLLCCDRALRESAYLNKSIRPEDYRCGQTYNANLPPAPDLSVSTLWCQNHCSGFALTQETDTTAWAYPLVQYILPAVVFSMTIPRRLALEPPRWFFEFKAHQANGLIKAIFSLCIAGMIVIIDAVLWIFMIMVAPGSFIFSGLVEAILDYRVIHNLLRSHTPRGNDRPDGLDRNERVQLLTAVLAGNLAIEGVPANPQKELGRMLNVEAQSQGVEVHLQAMLKCQYPFGAAVGGPILFYIGSFAYTIAVLQNAEGDQDTARALAFGIWWMNIVHVAAISGLLLASSNPSTAAAIVGKRRKKVDLKGRLDMAEKRSQLEDRIQYRLEAWSRLSLTHKARYEPVWMWNRGKSKLAWLQKTAAWGYPWFRDRIEMTIQGWLLLAFVAYLLVFLPCALAFRIEYATPPVGPVCRSMTILSYACAQVTFVVLSAWSHFKASKPESYWVRHNRLNLLRERWVGFVVSVVFLLPAWIVAVFTTFAGTLMQFSGIYQNCLCASTGYWFFPSDSTVTLSTDTELDRQSSRYWRGAGWTALIFLGCVTWLAWWGQRYLREKFIDRVKNLIDDGSHGSNELAQRPSTAFQKSGPANDPEVSDGSTLRDSDLGGLNNGLHVGEAS